MKVTAEERADVVVERGARVDGRERRLPVVRVNDRRPRPLQPRVFQRAAAEGGEAERVVGVLAAGVAIKAVAIVERRRVDGLRLRCRGKCE